jgi:hypothetical protein
MRAEAAVVAVVLVIAGVVTAALATRGPGRAPVATGPRTSATSEPHGNSPRAITVRTVDRLLAAVPVLPGSEPRAAAPAPEIRGGYSTPNTPDVVRRIQWSVAPGDMDDVLAYFAAHLPRGVRHYAGSGSYSDHGVTKVRSASYSATGPAET